MNAITKSPGREKAAEWLSKGVTPSQVAAALGVTPALISQWLSEEDFQSRVSGAKTQEITQVLDRESKANSLEDKVLDKLESVISDIYKPGELLNAYRVLNGRKRFGETLDNSSQAAGPVVQLVLPQTAINIFTQNAVGQVISVGNDSLVTIQSGNLDIMAARNKENRNGTKAPALPAPSTQDLGQPQKVTYDIE